MVRQFMHLVVATSIFACPLICRAGGAMPGSTQQRCCCHRHDPIEQPSRTPVSQNDSCQCICGGAVVEAVVQVDLEQWRASFGSDLLCAPLAISQPPFGEHGIGGIAFSPPSPPGSMNPGRALRYVLMSLLC